ncbi:conserved hypothetical protein [Sulfolobus islandicus Y.G.57.14]|jgi:hypothetical protein|uniref:Uncharacterized protein n=1 Tax=Saccharolobus islandicus (strain Y.G.57.14 / Yellowstone \|nr:hypothetical protein [Sulfolobus islandicus]ACP44900.1 conserved hypothetical protein [Sulfolobus islandicus Y.G.57.14]
MARYLHYISEGEIRDKWYAKIVEDLTRMGIDNVSIPELIVRGNEKADLVTYICKNDYCYPIFLFEFKNELNKSHRSICYQASNYASIINPYYTICVDLTKSLYYLIIYHGSNAILNMMFQSYEELFNYFFSIFLPRSLSASLNFTIPKNIVINKLFASPTYERFLRAEFVRILDKNNFCAISECSSINSQGSNIVKPDLAIYGSPCNNEELIDCEYPFLVLEFKSQYDITAVSQVRKYKDSLFPYYYGEVYGVGSSVKIEINNSKNQQIFNGSIRIGNPYLNDLDILGVISRLPKVSAHQGSLNGRYTIDELVKMGAKISRRNPAFNVRIAIQGFSLFLDRGGVKYPNTDYTIIIDCPAKLTRFVLFDPSGTLQWCEFQNGRLIRCNINVTAVMISSPCSRLIDKIYPDVP